MDADGSSHDRHRVLRECTRLIRANNARIRHRLAASKNSDKQIFCRHPFRRKRQGERHCQRQTFRHRDDDKRHRDNEDVYECKTLLVRCPRRVTGTQLNKESDEQSSEEQKTSSASQFSDKFGKSVKFELQGCVVIVRT